MVWVTVSGGFLLLGRFGDQGFGGEEEAGDRGAVLQRGAGDLGGIDDSGGEHIAPGAGLGVVAELGIGALPDPADDDSAVDAGVFGDVARGLFDGFLNDRGAESLVAGELEVTGGRSGADQGGAAAGDDAFFDRGAGGVQGVLDQGLAFFHFRFRGGADVDLGDTAGEFGRHRDVP